MKINLILLVASLAFGACAAAKVPPPQAKADAATNSSHERRQALVEDQMASEAALTGAERVAVAAIRADLRKNEAQQRAAVRDIRRDYRARTAAMTARHAADKKVLDVERM
jgi:hypothetical protein